MPIYEFECPECKKVEDFWCKMGEDKKKCPKCQKEMKKLISMCGWKLNGGGWYRTTPPVG